MVFVPAMGKAAGAAEVMATRFQAVSHRHPFIEDIAFALPSALAFRHFLQITQNAAAQMIDIVKAARADQCR